MKIKILIFLSIVNAVILGVVAFLSVFMYRCHITPLVEIAVRVIRISLLGSVLFKMKLSNVYFFWVSVILDVSFVLFMYGVVDSISVLDFFRRIWEGVYLVFFFIYLIWFYIKYYRLNHS